MKSLKMDINKLVKTEKLSPTCIFPILFTVTFYWIEIFSQTFQQGSSNISSQRVLAFMFVGSFFAEVHKFKYESYFIPYNFYSKIVKTMGTHGKFSTCRKTLEIFNGNFVKLHSRCRFKILVDFQISVVLFLLEIIELTRAY